MPKFLIGIGHNVPLLDLEEWGPYQPKPSGLKFARRTFTATGVKEEGPHIIFPWPQVTEAQWQGIMTQAGLDDSDLEDVTIYAQNTNYEWVRFNGEAVKPPIDRNGFWIRNTNVIVRKLEELAE